MIISFRRRCDLLRALEERNWLLEKEREIAAQAAVAEERARIARELHDIVSHNVSVMVVQAGAARQVLTADPELAAEALLAVEAAGRGAMTELRHLLGLLAPSASGEDAAYESAELTPQPTMARLNSLIDKFSFAGLPIEVRISGEPRALPSGIDVTAYRIIQEALTNAMKHGDRVKAEVTVRYADTYVRVEVLNSGPSVLSGDRTGTDASDSGGTGTPGSGADKKGDGTGHGLVGLRERVALYGGDLDARRRLGGGYRVRARIPLEKP